MNAERINERVKTVAIGNHQLKNKMILLFLATGAPTSQWS
jgi:hypothetical protein